MCVVHSDKRNENALLWYCCCRITVMCEKNKSEMESSNSRCIFLSLWLLLYVAGSPRSPKTKLIQKQLQKFQNEIKQKRTQTHTRICTTPHNQQVIQVLWFCNIFRFLWFSFWALSFCLIRTRLYTRVTQNWIVAELEMCSKSGKNFAQILKLFVLFRSFVVK